MHSSDHHQSHESLTESINGTKQKRKAPVVPNTNPTQETTINETVDEQQVKTTFEPSQLNITIDPINEQRIMQNF